MKRNAWLWSGLIALAAFGVFAAVARVLALAEVAAPLTRGRLAAAQKVVPAYADELPEFEEHFAARTSMTIFHVTTGAVFLTLGLLQFSASIRKRHLRFHRRSGYVLVALAVVAGTTGVWMGVVDPFSSTERLPSALAGAWFAIAAVAAIVAIRRGQVSRHREWMIRFFAIGAGVVVIRLTDAPILWLLRPAHFRDIVGLTFWAGFVIAAAVAEARIRSTRLAM